MTLVETVVVMAIATIITIHHTTHTHTRTLLHHHHKHPHITSLITTTHAQALDPAPFLSEQAKLSSGA